MARRVLMYRRLLYWARMPEFQYTALDRGGQTLSGWIVTPSKQQAISALAQEGRFVTDIEAKDESRRLKDDGGKGASSVIPGASTLKSRVPLRMKASMLAQLSTALSAGLPL